ncbi:ferredoxin--NADP reductase [Aggregatibacter kilianii]|uniref:ferredoxin--NADP reductase n=1 Tax=Aggregatibacter kilianii TaxID=2025884 RepID=UPI000D646846|nr:ferredoxin--NADP reductase [Aggregatibacter kilianii]
MNQTKKDSSYTEQRVLWVKKHTPKLLSFGITRPADFDFIAGQFAKLGFMNGEEYVSRAYSMISAEDAEHLDFYAILIEGGVMSAHFAQMKAGDTLLLEKKAVGFFTVNRIPQGKDLILLATGSGIAPFLSMLESEQFWHKADKIMLVHSVSYADDLVFEQYLANLKAHSVVGKYAEKLVYQPVVTREKMPGALHRRIPQLLASGELEQALNIQFNKADTRFLICGNPAMVKESYDYLKAQGYALHRMRKDGEIMMENAF